MQISELKSGKASGHRRLLAYSKNTVVSQLVVHALHSSPEVSVE